MTPGTTYHHVNEEIERLRGELVEEYPGRASPEELAEWGDDPVGWDREAGREPTDYQADVMRSVAENKLTAWRGCHSCGKEFTIGSLAVWAAYARGMKVLVVSATEQQVIGQTMTEVRRAWRDVREVHGIGGELYQGSVRVGDEDRIIALTGSANVDALTGWHDAENGVLVAISEGQGERLEAAAYDAAFGNVTTNKGRIVAAGNPVRPEGRFYTIHQKPHWQQFQTSAFDTPNVQAGELVRPGFPSPDWPKQIEREYGKDHAFYRGRVQAEFPETAQDALVDRQWVDAAFERHREGAFRSDAESEYAVVAVDVARFGRDASVLCARRGRHVMGFEEWQGEDTQAVARRVERHVRQLHDGGASPVRTLVVDAVGVGGGVVDRLRERLEEEPLEWWESGARGRGLRRRELRLEEFKGGKKARSPDDYRNLRSQAFWRIRRELEEGRLALPDDGRLREELQALRSEVTSDGRVKIEAKEKTKARLGGDSPDRADALSMTYLPELEDASRTQVRWAPA